MKTPCAGKKPVNTPENKTISIGISSFGRFLIVAHMDRGERTRVIGARELTRMERKDYENEIQSRNRL